MYTLFICTSTFSLFFTHSLGHFLTTMGLHVQIGCFISLIRYSLRSYASWGPRVYLYLVLVFLSLLLSYYFLILDISDSVIFPTLDLHDIMCGYLYVLLQWSWFIVAYFCSLFDYLRLNAYMWGILLAYMCHRLASRLRFSLFWEATVTPRFPKYAEAGTRCE